MGMAWRSKNPVCFLFLISLFLWSAPRLAASTFLEEELTARSAILINANTGQILYQREADRPLPPASTTKIVTAIVTLEHARLNQFFRVSANAARAPRSKIGLRPGRRLSVEDLLYSVLLSSANDASIVLAEGIGGSVPRFAAMMNQKAQQIGARQSHFVNPHGLTARGHESTARDMALLFNYAMRNPTFRQIVQTKTSSVNTLTIKTKRVRRIEVRNHNRLLWGFEGAIGGKTGYTYAAQKCFVGGASRDGTTLVVAVLGSRDLWGDTTMLLEHGFEMMEATSPTRASLVPVGQEQNGAAARQKSFGIPTGEEDLRDSSGAAYVIQAGSFRERGHADALFRNLLGAGYGAFLETVVLPDGELTYRVRIGPFLDLEAAQEAAQEIQSHSNHPAIILRPN